MGKFKKSFTPKRGEKRKHASSKNSFNKRKKISKDNRNEFSGKRKSNPDNKKLQKSQNNKQQLHNISEESEDENPFDQLVSSLGSVKDSKFKCVSSSDSESENDEVIDKGNEENDIEEQNSVSGDVSDDSVDEDELEKDVSQDPFEIHYQRDISDTLYNIISTPNSNEHTTETHELNFPNLGKCIFTRPKFRNKVTTENDKQKIDLSGENEKIYAEPGPVPNVIKNINWNNLSVKTQIQDNIYDANLKHVNSTIDKEKLLTSLQTELFTIINNYQDIYFPNRTLENGEEIRFVYCLHAVNHALKTRLKVIHHNSRLSDKNDVPDDFRDQGLVRPKVLIILPFRNAALRAINMIISILLAGEKANVVNKKRFFDEFTGGEIMMPRRNPKPLDYEQLFKGNTDDNFRMGISVTKKSVKLFADFYSSDIIVASPLGLRMIIGAEGEFERDFDFLASIEVLILDQTEIFLMQNWDHLLHIFDHLHMQPRQPHGTDFSRVRNWALNGWTQYYRQTLLFSSYSLPLITALFIRKCKNFAGTVTVSNPVTFGTICQVAVKVPQVFCRIECSSSVASADARFKYFITDVLPQMKEPIMKHTLIFVPSYLDYVMIRNYFKKETISFVQICEYSKDGKIARARDLFFHGESHFLLYSERFHFFRRIRVKGIRHIVFYQPPTFSNFYNEICNLLQDDNNTLASVTTLYTKYDLPQLAAIVGTERGSRLLHSNNNVHRIVAE